MLVVGILLTASSAEAIPQGTVIKEGVLIYPAGPYLTEDPLLLSLENYRYDNRAPISDRPFKTAYPEENYLYYGEEYLCSEESHLYYEQGSQHPENECEFSDNHNLNSRNLMAEDLWICPFNLFFIFYDSCINILYPNLVFLCCSSLTLFSLLVLSISFYLFY